MSQFHIRAQQTQSTIRFATKPAATTSEEVSESLPSQLEAGDHLTLSAKKQSGSQQPENLQDLMGEAQQEPRSQAFMERITNRNSGVALEASKVLSLELNAESSAPELLMASKDPGLMDSLKGSFSNPNERRIANNTPQTSNADKNEQVIKTGAKVKAGESVQLQVGMASKVDTDQLGFSGEALSQLGQMKTGVYAGVSVASESVSTRLSVDTVYGKPRYEVGAAVNASESTTVGVSFQNSSHDQFSAVRVGTEMKVSQETTLGVNLNQPISSGQSEIKSTSLGVYLNSKFD